MRKSIGAVLSLTLMAGSALAAASDHQGAAQQALDLAEKSIALRSVAGDGNQTPQVAALFREALIKGGFAPADVLITPYKDTAYLIARWPGSDPALKPLVISGHMDVVEAKASDWTHDPFKPQIENGYLLGRGSTDMKLDDTLAIAALLELKKDGYKPRRDIILEFSGDEETTMATGAIIASKLANAELVLNMDGANGTLDEKTGKPDYFTWEGAEKTYADFRLTVTNPGGHSSEPRAVNAIDELAADLLHIQQHRFKPELNDLSRSYFVNAARWQKPDIASAMKAFAANPSDEKAIRTLSADPAFVGRIGTTCVVTMIEGGHALNALPQRATANINCRIFPGHPRAAMMEELRQAAHDPGMTIEDATEGSVETAASPMRPDVVQAIEHGMHVAYPGVPVFAAMSSGASDSMWFRSHGVPSYGISPIFIKNSDSFMHGLNERTPVSAIAPAMEDLLVLIPDLSH
ncbi:M20/M25/M40 family metallo-hydrolase [Gluconobacter thailandicus]|uniref:M20/M25/M40 family metallo-hydrolase n=1 Tax=Gluconobacter thailandicus TaxID=257438 RepID=A0AAP9EQB2_GLUTH|nr:M20/M25/M40 family metallo-hydrolase [Gluconobacter thailandicus]QEH95306.1 M20/M25/M40 family metallo-hydrolase [Gluconobacter thailandicus]